jgi:hypothetical protein
MTTLPYTAIMTWYYPGGKVAKLRDAGLSPVNLFPAASTALPPGAELVLMNPEDGSVT